MTFIKRKIKSKKDIDYLLSNAAEFMNFDENGAKYYMFFPANKTKEVSESVTCTVMLYEQEDRWTMHRKGEVFVDANEVEITEDELQNLLWLNRREVNKLL